MPRAKKSHLPDGRLEPRSHLSPARWRERTLKQLRARLERDGYPRLEMSGLVAVTGFVGLAMSWVLLHLAGLESMGLRWGLATVVAYLVFLGLLRAWIEMRRDGTHDSHFDLPDFGGGSGGGGGSAGEAFVGGGGRFGGGGASASFESGAAVESDAAVDALGGAADGEGCLVLPVLLVLGAVLVGAAWLVLSAPTLLAELLLDALLAAGLYRRLRHAPPAHWLETAVRRTAAPFALTLVLVAGGGFALEQYAPGAATLSQALAAPRN
jgi:hypothetical protein